MMQDTWHRAVPKTERPSEKVLFSALPNEPQKRGRLHSLEEKGYKRPMFFQF